MIITNDPVSGLIPYDHFKDTKFCIGCKTKKGQIKYGIVICPECDIRVFVEPYGGIRVKNFDQRISSTSLHVDPSTTKYRRLEIIYRFYSNDTLISAEELIDGKFLISPLLVLPGILPMTQEYIDKFPDKLKAWLLFS